MNAKEAYELASRQDDISGLLQSINLAASCGETSVVIPRILNQFEIKKLNELGYNVWTDHGKATFGTSSAVATNHKIDWSNGGIDKSKPQDILASLASGSYQGR